MDSMVYADGIEFEQEYQREVEQFECVKAGGSISCDNVDAAIILRDAGKLEALKMLRSGVIEVVGRVSIDSDELDDLMFKVV